jgi:hypothetical protein
MNAALKSKKTQCSISTRPVPCRADTQVDLFGKPIPEKPFREKRLGYLGKIELIAEVRKVFPHAKVLPTVKSSGSSPPIRAWLQRAWLGTSAKERAVYIHLLTEQI